MCEKLVKDYDRCLICGERKGDCFLTHDHKIAKFMGQEHPFVLGGLVEDDMNLTPLCLPEDHQAVDRNKIRAYRSGGLNEFIIYLAVGYPEGIDEMRIAQRRSIVYLLDGIVGKITELNGAAPRSFQENYKRASDSGQYHIDRLLRLGID